MNQTRKIRWILYHEPIELFIRTAEAFRDEITQLTNGRISIEIYTLSEYSDKFNNGAPVEPMALMHTGDVEMSQIETGKLGTWNATDFFALELPFLFTSHDHCTRVLEGKIGQDLLEGLKTTTPVTGLAFTYSGGFRCVAADRKINTIEDLVGLDIITNLNPVRSETVKVFGCNPMPMHIKDRSDDAQQIRQTISAIETTLPRYHNEANTEVQKHVTNTKHSMYLTSIVISTEFWDSLTDDDQAAMREAALISSRLERQWSIDDAHRIANDKDLHESWGITFNELNGKETDKLKQNISVVYDKFSKFFTPGLVDGIIRG
jgi:TRAP-type C4-dicarboxylate transport system substrate-binding protein